MITLVPLCTMTLMLGKAVDAGNTPAGQRMAAEITSGTVSGRLILPDVRLAIQTDDGAVVLIRYWTPHPRWRGGQPEPADFMITKENRAHRKIFLRDHAERRG